MAENCLQSRGKKLAVRVDGDSGRFSHDSDAKHFQNQYQNRRQNRHENHQESPALTATIKNMYIFSCGFAKTESLMREYDNV
jgi:hypothetical protein